VISVPGMKCMTGWIGLLAIIVDRAIAQMIEQNQRVVVVVTVVVVLIAIVRGAFKKFVD